MNGDEPIITLCPACGRAHLLTAADIGDCGRQFIECTCGKSFPLPNAELESLPDIVSANRTEPPPLRGVWQDGPCVVVARGTRMPDRCHVCNASLASPAKTRTLHWVSLEDRRRMPRSATGLAVRFLVSSLEADHSRSIVVRVGRCPRHRFRVKELAVISASIAAVIACCWAACAVGTEQIIALILTGLFAINVVIAFLLVDRIRIVEYQDTLAWIRGYGSSYVGALPEFSDAYAGE